jgi:hypothetical protein
VPFGPDRTESRLEEIVSCEALAQRAVCRGALRERRLCPQLGHMPSSFRRAPQRMAAFMSASQRAARIGQGDRLSAPAKEVISIRLQWAQSGPPHSSDAWPKLRSGTSHSRLQFVSARAPWPDRVIVDIKAATRRRSPVNTGHMQGHRRRAALSPFLHRCYGMANDGFSLGGS